MERGFQKKKSERTYYSWLMISYLLDTSVIIDYLKGKSETVDLIDNIDGSVSSSYICLCELYDGLARMTVNQEKASSKIDGFFAIFDNVFGIDKKVSLEFGNIRADFKKRERVIEDVATSPYWGYRRNLRELFRN